MALFFYPVFFLISQLLLLSFAEEESNFNHKCAPFSCGKLGLIGFPFSNWTSPDCGLLIVDDCDKPVQKIRLAKDGPLYTITSIHQDITLNNTVTLEDRVFQDHLRSHSCESFKFSTLPRSSFLSFEIISNLTLFKCSRTLDHKPTDFSLPCNNSMFYYNHPNHDLPSLPPQCSLIQLPVKMNQSSRDLFNLLTGLFTLRVHVSRECGDCLLGGNRCHSDTEGNFNCAETKECHDCHRGGGKCIIDYKKGFQCLYTRTENENMRLKLGLGLGASASGVFILIILAFCLRKKLSLNNLIILCKNKTESYLNIEAFVRNYGTLAIKRYSYTDIKKMTNSFKHNLGQGGYGGVYKGKLFDGRNVAVKVLNESKGNGEEFINEVASISRTSHVNIVTLLGFCFEGSRRALIYEFMPNGSLEKFIYENSSLNTCTKLKWKTLYKIAVGIARGLEYLHRGCSTRIFHFDIKPHNILLDEDFCPKISDFGLAKICSQKQSIVSMTGARGTVGYIAPEVFCRNFGQVSYKSDVYSYGMMVFEMTGKKNNDAVVNHSSDVYFPHWIYKRLETDEDLGLQGIENEEDMEYAMKMIIVSLWCIQNMPSNRPTMSRVLDMLKGSVDSLQIPPKPFLSSAGSPADSSSSTEV